MAWFVLIHIVDKLLQPAILVRLVRVLHFLYTRTLKAPQLALSQLRPDLIVLEIRLRATIATILVDRPIVFLHQVIVVLLLK